MTTVPFSVYDAFSDVAFGGSQGGIVLDAGDVDAGQRLQIAKELGLPAICFVSALSDTSIAARFQSTEREYPMCGHGTICLMTHLLELGLLSWNGRDEFDVELDLSTNKARVEVHRRSDDRALVMLDIKPPTFRPSSVDLEIMAGLLGITVSDYHHDLPIETAMGDFVHLVVPVKDLTVMQAIAANFSGITQYCHEQGIETVACFSTQTQQPDHTIHVRDFCPAVGVPESAAAGTTNAALTSYLIRHGVVQPDEDGHISVKAEQGLEIRRPSSIASRVVIKDGAIARLQIGGVASKVFEGQLHLPAARGDDE